MRRIFVLVLLALSFGREAFAQKDLARERVSLQFKDTPIAQVFPALAKSLGYDLSLDRQLRALVTLQVENVSAQTALTAICESVGCHWRVSEKRLIVEARRDVVTITRLTPKGEQLVRAGGNPTGLSVSGLDDRLPFDIMWSPVNLNYALVMLARTMNAQADVPPALGDRKIAVSIQNASLRQALDAVCGVGSCRWELVQRPNRVIRAFDREAQGEARRVYRANELGVTHPRVLSESKPDYPADLIHEKIQGHVTLAGVVEADGTVSDVNVVESLDPRLDQKAIEAFRRWRFTPGTKDGRAVPVRVQTEFTFTVK